MLEEMVFETDVPVKKICIVEDMSGLPTVEEVAKDLVKRIVKEKMPRGTLLRRTWVRLVSYDADKGEVKLNTKMVLERDEIFYEYAGLVTIHGKCRQNRCEPVKATIYLTLAETIKL